MPIYALAEHLPNIHQTAWVAPSAEVIGRVNIAAQASIWFAAVLRGDNELIEIGPSSNVQDGAVLHTDWGFPCTLAEEVTVGHRAVIHGARCEAGSLVGMGAIMLNGSSLGAGAVLGAGALLPEGRHIPPGMLALGVPAKAVRPVGRPEGAAHYLRQAARYHQHLRLLTLCPDDRVASLQEQRCE